MSTMKQLRRGAADPPAELVFSSSRGDALKEETVSDLNENKDSTPGVSSRRQSTVQNTHGSPAVAAAASLLPACDDNDSVGISSILDFLNRISTPNAQSVNKQQTSQSTPRGTQQSAPAVSPLSSSAKDRSTSSEPLASHHQSVFVIGDSYYSNPKLAAWTTRLQEQAAIDSNMSGKQLVAAVSQSPLTFADGSDATTFGSNLSSPATIPSCKDANKDPPPAEHNSNSSDEASPSVTQRPPPQDRPLNIDSSSNKVDQSTDALSVKDLLSNAEKDNMQQIMQRVKDVLLEAQQERESVRSWANSMRLSVHAWVRQQRELVHCERTHTVDQLEDLWNANRQILVLQEALELSQVDMETAAAEHVIVETNLRALTQKQEDEIRLLQQRIRSLEQEHGVVAVSEKDSIDIDTDKTSDDATFGGSSDENVANSCDPSRAETRTTTFPGSSKLAAALTTLPQNPKEIPSTVRQDPNPTPSRGRRVLRDGNVVVSYRNGTEKLIRRNGSTIIHYRNGDIKEEAVDGSVSYFHAADKTIHTRRADGVNVYEYPNRQVEQYYPNGEREIILPDGKIVRLCSGDEAGGVLSAIVN